MSEKDVARWEKTRAKGKWRFIIVRAAVFGSMLFLVKIVMDFLWGDPVELRPYFLWLYPVLGLVAGASMWWIADAQYQNYILDKKIHDHLKL